MIKCDFCGRGELFTEGDFFERSRGLFKVKTILMVVVNFLKMVVELFKIKILLVALFHDHLLFDQTTSLLFDW